MTKKKTSAAMLGLNFVLWGGVAYIGLATAAMQLGEVMHDIHCRDHVAHVGD